MKRLATAFYAPGWESQEKDGLQPILYAIMAAMVQLVGHGNHIAREQWIFKVGNRKFRVIDFVANLTNEYLLAFLPVILGVEASLESFEEFRGLPAGFRSWIKLYY